MKTALTVNVILATLATWIMATINPVVTPVSISPTFGVMVCAWITWFVLGGFVTILPAGLASE